MDSQESSPIPQFKSINSSAFSFLYSPTLTSRHDTGKTIALTRWTIVGKVMSLHFNMLSRLVITFLPRSKRLLISWLQSPSAVILDFVTLWTVAHQAPLSRGFSRQEYWTGLPCPPPGDLSDPGSNPCLFSSPVLVGGFFTTSATWEAPYIYS